ncbi:MAG: DMT family transporter [Azospirillaceae bacterium]
MPTPRVPDPAASAAGAPDAGSTPANTATRRRGVLVAGVEGGMLVMTLAMLIAPGMDAIAKLLGEEQASGQVAFTRFALQTLILLPVCLIVGDSLRPRLLGLHAARGALIGIATLCFFTAITVMPLADALAVFFVEPLILTLMSAIFLGEPIGWRRLSAVVVGFAGALVIVGPSWDVFGPAALLPLGAATALSGYLVLTRRLAAEGGLVAMQVWAGLFGALVLGVALAAGAATGIGFLTPSVPPVEALGWMAALGVLAAVSHLLIVIAFSHAPAGVLAPFHYLEILMATALGYFMFGDFPGLATWGGLVLIVGAGLYVFHRERRLARAAAHAPTIAPT